uniref:Peptidase S1 domain-containing protein n=1 Tax=Stomoxys calcitrans TaxID=35570 RepID=A0A1I8P7H0_STOCA
MKFILSVVLALAIFGSLTQGRGISQQQLKGISQHLKDVRVIGGSDVAEGALPYQVSIQNTFGEHVCGGSIIAPLWVLTAAHCLEWPKQYLKVVTGTVNWTKPDAEYAVDDLKIHCLHNKPMYHNDIALIRLSKPIVYNQRTQPVNLATSNSLNDGDKLTLSGWGSIKVWGRTPDILQSAELSYMDHAKCEAGVRNSEWLGAGHICTDTKSGQGSCHGDSGGPLYNMAKNELVGIVNWGEACAVGYPDVFASVAYYHDWIMTNMNGGAQC